MAEDTSAEDRTEEPTARRLSQATEEGESARSSEVTAAAVVIAATTYLFYTGPQLTEKIISTFSAGFTLDRKFLDSPQLLPAAFASMVFDGFLLIVPLLALTVIVAIAASAIVGGFHFSMKAVSPNFGRMNPAAGLARMFGSHAIVELIKAMAKFGVVGAATVWVLSDQIEVFNSIGAMALEPALVVTGTLLVKAALSIACSLLLIAAADGAYQHWSFSRRMRMTKQEIRDEMKDMEGQPEVKAQIRRRQREMAGKRMIDRVKDADVIITNPDHFSIALSYDPSRDGAPTLIAKGSNLLALRIREEAKRTGVYIFPAPPLARALYFTTKVDQQIPEGLYVAVARVIAYVFNLSNIRPGSGDVVKPAIVVPEELRFNSDGTPEKTQ